MRIVTNLMLSRILLSSVSYEKSFPLIVTRMSTNLASTSSSTLQDSPSSSSSSLLDPHSLFDGKIPYPKSLSPSSAAEFKACPQNYLFRYLYGIKEPPNLALAQGSLVHKALEQVFDLEPQYRTIEHLQNLLRKNWSEMRLLDDYKHLFDVPLLESENETVTGKNGTIEERDREPISFQTKRDIEAERTWGEGALRLLSNYYQVEDPRLVPRPNPIEREVWVSANLTIDASKGVTGYVSNEIASQSTSTSSETNSKHSTFLVRGIVDRLDFIKVPPTPRSAFTQDRNNIHQEGIRIVDYKTGKAPQFKYTPQTNERIAAENLWQLKIYALLLREMIASGKASSKYGNLQLLQAQDLRFLRLFYLTSEEGGARYLETDLGETQQERDAILQEVHKDLSNIWTNITMLVDTQDPKAFVHCNRKWCNCHTTRSKFVPHTVWEG